MWIDLSQHMSLATDVAADREAEPSARPTTEPPQSEIHRLISGRLRVHAETRRPPSQSCGSDADDPDSRREPAEAHATTRRVSCR